MWNWTLGQMGPGRRATVSRVAADVGRKSTGYMFGNLLTSLIAGTVVFVTLLIIGEPFPLLWGLWGALQVLVREIWQATAPNVAGESPAPAAEAADDGAGSVAGVLAESGIR